jgi:hypothetical protein
MTRIYTQPVEVPDETKAQIMSFGMVIDLNASLNPTADSYFTYVVNTYNDDGDVIQSVTRNIVWPDIPSSAQTQIRELYDLVLTHAENTGLIAPGTDENDL